MSPSAPFFGALGNIMLVGILLSQGFTYYSTYRKSDKWRSLFLFIPCLVGLLLVAAGLHATSAYLEVSLPDQSATTTADTALCSCMMASQLGRGPPWARRGAGWRS